MTGPQDHIPVDVTAPESFAVQQATIGTSAVQLSTFALAQGVTLTAKGDNTNIIYVGTSSGVTSGNGYGLEAGKSVFIATDDKSDIWVIGGAASQVLYAIGS